MSLSIYFYNVFGIIPFQFENFSFLMPCRTFRLCLVVVHTCLFVQVFYTLICDAISIELTRSALSALKVSAFLETPAFVFGIIVNFAWLQSTQTCHLRILTNVINASNFPVFVSRLTITSVSILAFCVASIIAMHFMYDEPDLRNFLVLNPLYNLNNGWFLLFAAYEYAVAVCINGTFDSIATSSNDSPIHVRIAQYDAAVGSLELYAQLFGIPKLARRTSTIVILLVNIFSLLELYTGEEFDLHIFLVALTDLMWMSTHVLYILNVDQCDKFVLKVRFVWENKLFKAFIAYT